MDVVHVLTHLWEGVSRLLGRSSRSASHSQPNALIPEQETLPLTVKPLPSTTCHRSYCRCNPTLQVSTFVEQFPGINNPGIRRKMNCDCSEKQVLRILVKLRASGHVVMRGKTRWATYWPTKR
jgi:hypothetical protein